MTFIYFLSAAALFGFVSYRLRWLSLSGSIAASLFGFCLLWLGGIAWVVPLMVFFASSSILSKVGKKKRSQEKRPEDVRNATQVLANGGVAWGMLLINAVDPQAMWYAGYIGALAAATADTWATEIGRLGGGQPRNILTGGLVEKGLSGGITWQGTIGSCVGAAVLGASCVPFYDALYGYCILLGLFAGAAGSLMDSVLGATVQAKYRDDVSGEIVEKPHGDAHLIQGFRVVTNDVVNVFCTVVGCLVAILLAMGL